MAQYSITVDDRAHRDIRAAKRWYRDLGIHLARALTSEVVQALDALQDAPLRWREWRSSFRRLLLTKYPYFLVYRVENRQIIVVALMHQQQDATVRFPEDP